MALIGIAIDRFHFLRRTRNCGFDVALLVANKGLLGIKSFGQHGLDRGGRDSGVCTIIPDNIHRIERCLGAIPSVGDDNDSIAIDHQYFFDAAHFFGFRRVNALHLATGYRCFLDGSVQHAGHFEVDGIDLRSIELGFGVKARQRLASNRPILRILDLHIFRRFELGGCSSNLAVTQGAARGLMRDDAFRGGQFRNRHFPLVGSSLHQHHACGRTALAHIIFRATNAARTGGLEIPPDALARNILSRCRIFGLDLRPIGIELFSHKLGEARQCALAHFDARHAHDNGIVGFHNNPSVDFRRITDSGFSGWNMKADGQSTSGHGSAGKKAATRKFLRNRHVIPPGVQARCALVVLLPALAFFAASFTPARMRL